jgi:hypothetical protein
VRFVLGTREKWQAAAWSEEDFLFVAAPVKARSEADRALVRAATSLHPKIFVEMRGAHALFIFFEPTVSADFRPSHHHAAARRGL